MFSDLSCEVEESEILHPVVIVHHLSLVRRIGVKVQEFRHLLFDAFLIVSESLVVQQVSLLAFSRRVANHSSSTTNEDDGFVSAMLQVA